MLANPKWIPSLKSLVCGDMDMMHHVWWAHNNQLSLTSSFQEHVNEHVECGIIVCYTFDFTCGGLQSSLNLFLWQLNHW